MKRPISIPLCLLVACYVALGQLAAAGAIVFMATHDLDLADGLVTRVALVRGGKLEADAPAEPGIRARYRDLVGR